MILNLEFDIEEAKRRVNKLDKLRLTRAIENTPPEVRTVLELLPVFLHYNHPSLIGYVKGCPHGIYNFTPTRSQQISLHKHFFNHENVSYFSFPELKQHTGQAFLGLYAMGSVSTITQTPNSDLDIWLCERQDFSGEERKLLRRKIKLIQQWASKLKVKISLYLVNQKRFRKAFYAKPLSAEKDDSGSAQYMLLLEEFYRTAIRLAGNPLLWLHLPVEEKDYESYVHQLVSHGQIKLRDWVDFGGLDGLSANEYFGATLWQLYKGIDSPYKSALKILLLESYSAQYPNTHLISQEFKKRLHSGDEDYHYDAYLCMLEHVSRYLTKKQDQDRLEFAYRCFYLKIAENLRYKRAAMNNWRIRYAKKLARSWGWSESTIENLDDRPHWKIKRVKKNHNDLIQYLMASYRNLLQFVRNHKVNASIVPQDMAVLTRKLYTAFEDLPGKVIFLNSASASDLSEKALTFVEVRKDNINFKPGWYLLNHAPNVKAFTAPRHSEFGETLPKIVAWAYFNGLLTPKTKNYLKSDNVRLKALQRFIKDLCNTFPLKQVSASQQELIEHCKIRQLFIAINLSCDVTQDLPADREIYRKGILTGDLLNITSSDNQFIGSLDVIYRNRWGEIRTLHFEGDDALIRLLKVLTHKIPRTSTELRRVNIFCYAKHYQKELQSVVQSLIFRTLGIEEKIRINETNMASLIRYTGHGWSKLFQKNAEKPELRLLKENNAIYPKEIAVFAAEGFLQFFFEDNQDRSFNVYILDEKNHIEVYRSCIGNKSQKINEINQIYQSAGLNTDNNPYRIVKHHFNYPQFYQLLPVQGKVQIVPFRHQLKMT
ncbi:class I adenylate cyclase [Actinobacillus delphinicola]|uniref:Adenylate cyclase n=1 Tax=Actinobacillus delphinicola TaxID=51161 RepID=A0A448TTW0_9PAST|nr:class I adenylate cyclase [Actinobacillus delphinicola]VEJ09273.1 adenylate cyclase [Actinobacillus delphinicola]